ncbi:MAG: hypothetical protein COX57_05130 [Alphaproteobacteria bacterium CG_4_10_14_0_2_um_filter_63_37]|nr:MAG: hypothetical protein AUJ55_05125 [Proteobacteria bacterium CG1_02_64_396]PJA25111.1 MAG: hypothetical protein COX57_05130 [Alphaproteobacteria bacterium CG_4_10_14_0_2_um_filter_63_37]
MSTASNTPTRPQAVPAGPFFRLAALFYDLLILASLLFLVSALTLWLLPEGVRTTPLGHGITLLLAVLTIYLYHFYFWLKGGSTSGQAPWKLRVVQIDGRHVTAQQAALRTLYLLALWPIGWVWWFFSDGRLLHEVLSQTRTARIVQAP